MQSLEGEDMAVTIVRTKDIGKAGAKRTVHHLSNGMWINESGRGHRGFKFSLYKGTPSRSTYVKGANKLQELVDYADS
jgi:hypothetical protein